MLTNANVAKYAEAPPWPTDENNNAAKKISGMSRKISDKIVKVLRINMLCDCQNHLAMQASALACLHMRGNLITHIFGPKFIEVIGDVFLRLGLIWLGLKKVANLVCHFD